MSDKKMKVPLIRFAGFTGEWEERKLGEIVDIRGGRDYKHLANGDIPVYGTGGYMLSVNEALSYNDDAIGIGRKGTIDKPYPELFTKRCSPKKCAVKKHTIELIS